MSIKFEKIEKEEFEANMATLFCDETGKKMLEIIIMDSDKKNTVQAKWSNFNSQTSGKHEIIGDIYCSPIETATQKTAIIKVMTEDKGKTTNHRVIVKSI